MTIRRTLQQLQQSLGSESPALDASLLVAHVCGLTREQLYLEPDRLLEPGQQQMLERLAERRRHGTPVAYLLGYKEFYGRVFQVDDRALIPRPDTEILVEAGLQAIDRHSSRPVRVLDLCCGTGCVGITLAAERPGIELQLADIDNDALQLAAENAARLLPTPQQPVLIQSDLFASLSGRYDVIVSNPPYVREQDYRALEMQRWGEPRHALVAREEGLEIIRRIADTVVDYIYPNGYIAIEAADHQAPHIAELLARASFQSVEHLRDLAGHLRVTAGTHTG
ncbi:peptide chain release factor N(5)-glutamine methyltransferase [Spirochaeta africana]|uniref:Release factor glutamine methyltransferase n=1 Tax=Spirochaeta africana (strain ATCC 700263 / DSM 8902 / Z-7692) TaxID=889378 RepID=H9UK38_SPIAZ|nr:peptide chain release factor N(5)-glutamine methyltransferase [Spirochaeta africana]AFG37881.1 protein-(glutamine-N5) methyltransferase, release factor-specific [Spirochaeta africana DSM 8902]